MMDEEHIKEMKEIVVKALEKGKCHKVSSIIEIRGNFVMIMASPEQEEYHISVIDYEDMLATKIYLDEHL